MVGRWDGAATRSLIMHADPLVGLAYRCSAARADLHHRPLVRMVLEAFARRSMPVRPGRLRQPSSRAAASQPGMWATSRPFRWASSRACSRPGCARPGFGERFSRASAWTAMRSCWSASAASPVRNGGRWCFALSAPPVARRRSVSARSATARGGGVSSDCRTIAPRRVLAANRGPQRARAPARERATLSSTAAKPRPSAWSRPKRGRAGVPLIVPDRGAAVDQLVPGAGAIYRSGREDLLTEAIAGFAARAPNSNTPAPFTMRTAAPWTSISSSCSPVTRSWLGNALECWNCLRRPRQCCLPP